MPLPFSAEQFFAVFAAYNRAVWPLQVVLLALALAAAGICLRRGGGRHGSTIVSAVLAGLWAWQGLAYHLAFFARINPAAYGFAALALAGALVFLWQGVIRRRLRFGWTGGWRTGWGLGLIVFACFVYPLWSWWTGHAWPAMPTFGLPCPTTLFTLGVLAFARPPYPRAPLVVPVLWCLVGAQAAFMLGMHADLALLVAAGVGVALFVRAGGRPLRRRFRSAA